MNAKKIILIIIVVLTVTKCFLMFHNDEHIKNQEKIDQIHLEDVERLMIVAHPDDETIWGGKHLLEGHYLVVCLTNGDNVKRKNEFMNIMKKTSNQGLILDYPDKINGKRDNWYGVKDDIQKDIHYLLLKKKWKMIVTHNPDGEYGHIHHQMTSMLVSTQKNIDQSRLLYFGKYYKMKNKPKRLQQISANDLEMKMELIGMYRSQSKVMDHLSHMMAHENWVKARDWR